MKNNSHKIDGEKHTAAHIPPPNASIGELLAHWNIQENLFQGYRRLYITLETILLSLSSLIVSRSYCEANNTQFLFELFLLLILALFGTFVSAWLRPIINKRGELVFFWQSMILKVERGEQIHLPLQRMKAFQKNINDEFRTDEDFKRLLGGKHRARIWLQKGIPLAIFAAWLVVLLIFVLKYLLR